MPWDLIVEKGRSILKDNWGLKIMAIIAAGIKSRDETYDEYAELNNSDLSLCKRTRCARMKSGNLKYWETQFSDNTDNLFSLLVFFTWATPKVIVQLLPLLSEKIHSMNNNDLEILVNALSCTSSNSIFDKSQQKNIEVDFQLNKTNDVLKYIVSMRFDYENRQKYIYSHIRDSKGVLEKTTRIKFQYLIGIFMKAPTNNSILNDIKNAYKSINNFDERRYYRHRYEESIEMPYEIAKSIMKECKEYPIIISSLAEKTCRLYANEKLKAVGEIAKNEKWFDGN